MEYFRKNNRDKPMRNNFMKDTEKYFIFFDLVLMKTNNTAFIN